MNFDFNDEQREIKTTARDFLASRFTPERIRELAEAESPYDDGLWGEICDLGWAGISLSEEHGGQGLGAVEAVIIAEEMGWGSADFAIDNRPPGYRMLELMPDGAIQTEVCWLESYAQSVVA